MQNNSEKFSIERAMKLANSPEGRQLIAMLKQTNPEAISKAMQQASSGDYSNISQTLAPVLNSEDIKKLLRRMGE
ncbi:MAG: hypothetical protein IKC95_05210 [Oscillospiraceae bacterium]|nr:hypothetical protein [Oscillospiraceae bacterium]